MSLDQYRNERDDLAIIALFLSALGIIRLVMLFRGR
jgi:hypothetical protein